MDDVIASPREREPTTEAQYISGSRYVFVLPVTSENPVPKAEPAATTEIDTWRLQTRITRDVIGANTHGLSQEDSLVQPQPAGNCLNWVLGHLLHVYDGVLPLLGQQSVLGTEALQHYARGREPIREGSEALDFQQLVAAMNEAAERMDAGLAAVSPDLLDQPAPMSPPATPTRRSGRC